jgi:hypothetical protein
MTAPAIRRQSNEIVRNEPTLPGAAVKTSVDRTGLSQALSIPAIFALAFNI